MIAVAATVAATVLWGALLEWFVHRVAFHRWAAHLHAPHHAEFHGEHFQRPGPYRNLQRWWLELVAVALHAPLFAGVGWLVGLGPMVAAIVVLSLYAAASNVLHTSIHCPNGRWIERTAWHRRLVERHREHHLDARVNFTVPTQLSDRLLRSFREAARAPGRTATPARSSAPGS